METAELGQTGKRVSRLGFGGAPAGLTDYLSKYTPEDQAAREQVIAAIHRALELGVTYFDTAAGYGLGESERIFGESLADQTDIFLATKVSRNDFPNIRKSLESSLERLNRSSVDLLQLHGSSFDDWHIDTILKAGGAADQLDKLKQEGLIRSAGFTTEDNNEAVYKLIQSSRFDVMQICYNFVYQHPYEPSRPFGSIIEAHNRGMGIVTMRAMTSGILQRWIQNVNPDNTFDYTPALLQFVLSNPLVNVGLAGMITVDEVVQNAAIASDLENRISMDWLHERYIKRSDA